MGGLQVGSGRDGYSFILFFGITLRPSWFHSLRPFLSPVSKPLSSFFQLRLFSLQASTTLWGEIPEEMSEALDVHHAVIRKLIQKHKCYEVKTIGDCFMIATADPAAGLTLALAIQDVLFDYDWGTPAFEEVYRFQTQDESPEYEYSQVMSVPCRTAFVCSGAPSHNRQSPSNTHGQTGKAGRLCTTDNSAPPQQPAHPYLLTHTGFPPKCGSLFCIVFAGWRWG